MMSKVPGRFNPGASGSALWEAGPHTGMFSIGVNAAMAAVTFTPMSDANPMNRKALLISVAVTLCVLLVGGCTTRQPHPAPVMIRVMTYNIHHGEGLDGKVDLTRIADLIKAERADVVALQEVDRGVRRTAQRDMPAELAALTGMTCVFSNNFPYQGGEYGNAVLTRFLVKRWTNHHYRMLRPNEQRGILQLVLDVHGRELVVMNTHIDSRADDAERWLNVGEIEGLTKAQGATPVILCGDFNNVPTGRVYQRLSETFQDAWIKAGAGDGFSFPASGPNRRIDYLWFNHPEAVTPRQVWIPQSAASDHLPVVADFEIEWGD
jgi:endonuclease/exonuclease/phosphatase family metal-dependent hydrolase